ncbi:MAG: TetR/AcrR family transcriptional regulator [Dehalococcoidia bacterium]
MSTLREQVVEERRQEILAAALGVFVRKGLSGATMQDIASAVGLTAGALYRYFPGKDDLVAALFAECEAEQQALFAEVAGSDASPLERIVQTGVAAWTLFDQPDARERMAISLEGALSGYRDELAGAPGASMPHALVMMRALVEEAQAAKQLPSDVDAEALASMLVAVHHGLQVMQVQLDGAVEPGAVLDVLTRMLSLLGEVSRARQSAGRGGTRRRAQATSSGGA